MVYDLSGKCIFEGNFDSGTIVDGIIDPFVNQNTEQPIFCSSFCEQLENDNPQMDVAVKRPNCSFNSRKEILRRDTEDFLGNQRGSVISLTDFKEDRTKLEVINVSSRRVKSQDSSFGGSNWLLNYQDPNGGTIRKSKFADTQRFVAKPDSYNENPSEQIESQAIGNRRASGGSELPNSMISKTDQT